jgi:predicted HicB family RNase H-like nuclease
LTEATQWQYKNTMSKPPEKRQKNAVIQIRIDAETKAKAEIAAAEDNRNLTQWVTALIKAALNGKRTR